MSHFRKSIIVLGIGTLMSSGAWAQEPARRGGGPPAPLKNLQILPADIPRPQLTQIMQGFNAALGVQCAYCHEFVGPGNAANDMASDSKTPKMVARVMMQMTGEINAKIAANVKKSADQLTSVTCATCHRGAAIPVNPPPPAPAPAAAAPPAAR
ncbi:MAG: c-type cytochrome [Vicinamibacterales bacterium]|nr:c-type cytochrome [Vicinamibacterales bacterium]